MTGTLYRSRRRRVIGGVAAGLGQYLNFDPILVRIVMILIALLNGVGIILYIILWIIIPEEPLEVAFNMGPGSDPVNPAGKDVKSEQEKTTNTGQRFTDKDIESKLDEQKSGGGRTVAGIILIAIGMIFLIDNLFPYFDFKDFVPVALIGFGIALIWHSLKK